MNLLAVKCSIGHTYSMRASSGVGWVLGAALLLACSGKALRSSSDGAGEGGAANSIDLSSGLGGGSAGHGGLSGSGGEQACRDCPAAPDVQLCCADFCGYLNTDSGECVPSSAGSRIFPMVSAPEGWLCSPRWHCDSSAGCPALLPSEGSDCTEELTCNYCAAPATVPRTVRCLSGAWLTIGPNPPCAYVVDPPR